jgi:hypothetical protein
MTVGQMIYNTCYILCGYCYREQLTITTAIAQAGLNGGLKLPAPPWYLFLKAMHLRYQKGGSKSEDDFK